MNTMPSTARRRHTETCGKDDRKLLICSGKTETERGRKMEQKLYKVMNGAGAANITIGVVTLVVGIVSGILLIVAGAKLIAGKSKILF